jgi:hypothetical protein
MHYYLASLGSSLVFRSRSGSNSLKKCRSRFEKGIRAKGPRLRLDLEAYRKLCLEVMERDGWRSL